MTVSDQSPSVDPERQYTIEIVDPDPFSGELTFDGQIAIGPRNPEIPLLGLT